MDLPTYTNIWRIEKRLYKLYDFRLPMPLPVGTFGVAMGIFLIWVVLLSVLNAPFDFGNGWHLVLWVVPPGVITVLATRPVIEGKRLTELLISQARFFTEPRVMTRLAPEYEPGEVRVSVRVWHRHPDAGPLPLPRSHRAEGEHGAAQGADAEHAEQDGYAAGEAADVVVPDAPPLRRVAGRAQAEPVHAEPWEELYTPAERDVQDARDAQRERSGARVRSAEAAEASGTRRADRARGAGAPARVRADSIEDLYAPAEGVGAEAADAGTEHDAGASAEGSARVGRNRSAAEVRSSEHRRPFGYDEATETAEEHEAAGAVEDAETEHAAGAGAADSANADPAGRPEGAGSAEPTERAGLRKRGADGAVGRPHAPETVHAAAGTHAAEEHAAQEHAVQGYEDGADRATDARPSGPSLASGSSEAPSGSARSDRSPRSPRARARERVPAFAAARPSAGETAREQEEPSAVHDEYEDAESQPFTHASADPESADDRRSVGRKVLNYFGFALESASADPSGGDGGQGSGRGGGSGRGDGSGGFDEFEDADDAYVERSEDEVRARQEADGQDGDDFDGFDDPVFVTEEDEDRDRDAWFASLRASSGHTPVGLTSKGAYTGSDTGPMSSEELAEAAGAGEESAPARRLRGRTQGIQVARELDGRRSGSERLEAAAPEREQERRQQGRQEGGRESRREGLQGREQEGGSAHGRASERAPERRRARAQGQALPPEASGASEARGSAGAVAPSEAQPSDVRATGAQAADGQATGAAGTAIPGASGQAPAPKRRPHAAPWELDRERRARRSGKAQRDAPGGRVGNAGRAGHSGTADQADQGAHGDLSDLSDYAARFAEATGRPAAETHQAPWLPPASGAPTESGEDAGNHADHENHEETEHRSARGPESDRRERTDPTGDSARDAGDLRATEEVREARGVGRAPGDAREAQDAREGPALAASAEESTFSNSATSPSGGAATMDGNHAVPETDASDWASAGSVGDTSAGAGSTVAGEAVGADSLADAGAPAEADAAAGTDAESPATAGAGVQGEAETGIGSDAGAGSGSTSPSGVDPASAAAPAAEPGLELDHGTGEHDAMPLREHEDPDAHGPEWSEHMSVLDSHLSKADTPAPPRPKFADVVPDNEREPEQSEAAAWFDDGGRHHPDQPQAGDRGNPVISGNELRERNRRERDRREQAGLEQNSPDQDGPGRGPDENALEPSDHQQDQAGTDGTAEQEYADTSDAGTSVPKPPTQLDHGTGELASFSEVRGERPLSSSAASADSAVGTDASDAPHRRTADEFERAEVQALEERRRRAAREPSEAGPNPAAEAGPGTDAEQAQGWTTDTSTAPGTDPDTRSGPEGGTDPDAAPEADPDAAERTQNRSAPASHPRANPSLAALARDHGPDEYRNLPAQADADDRGTADATDGVHEADGATGTPYTDRAPGPDNTDVEIDHHDDHHDEAHDGVFHRVANNARRLGRLFGQPAPGEEPGPDPERKPELELDHGTGEQERLGDTPNGVPAQRPERDDGPEADRADRPESGGTRGWRRLARVVTGGASPVRSDLPPSDIERLRTPLAGPRNLVVLGCTGGAGQTVTALMIGHTLAAHRDDRVVAVDVNPGPNGLSRRVGAQTPETLTALLANADGVQDYEQMRSYVSRASTGLEVVQTLDDPYVQTLDDRDYGQLAGLLGGFYGMALMDPAATGVSRALPGADGLVLVAPASADAERAVSMTFEWLDGNGYSALRANSVLVVNGVSKRSLPDVDAAERVARGRCRAIVRVPWDDHLGASYTRIDVGALRSATKRAHGALGGVLVRGLGD